MTTDPSRTGDRVETLTRNLAEFVGVKRAEEIVSKAVDATSLGGEMVGERDIIRVCRLIEQRHSGVVASVASEFRGRQEAEQRFRNLVAPIPDPVCVVTAEQGRLTVREANDACIEMFGRGEMGDDSLGELLERHDDDPPVDRIRDAVGTRTEDRFETSVETALGDRYFLVRISPFEAAENPRSATVLFTDITEQKRQSERLRRLQQVTDVLNRVLRHNLRNEMNVVLGLVGQVQTRVAGDAVQADLDAIRSRSQDLLDMAKDARGIQDAVRGIERDQIDVVPIAHSHADRLRTDHAEATVTVDTPETAVAVGDKHLETVLSHLLDNAVEHNDKDDPTVSLTVTRDDDEIVVEVTDNGPGINPQNLSVIEQGAEYPLEHGHGLGLWLTVWVVDQYGGDVDFHDHDPTADLCRSNT